MELTYFYKAEMPNYQDWTLDVSKAQYSIDLGQNHSDHYKDES